MSQDAPSNAGELVSERDGKDIVDGPRPADRLQNARDSPLTDLRQFDILHLGPAGGDRMHLELLNRRYFITLLGGAAAAWPLVARAQ